MRRPGDAGSAVAMLVTPVLLDAPEGDEAYARKTRCRLVPGPW